MLISDYDWQLEDWLETEGAHRLQADPTDQKAIRTVYLWKRGADQRHSGSGPTVPDELYSPHFAEILGNIGASTSDEELIAAIRRITSFPGVGVRTASAFAYWLRPNDYQLIDRRVTSALDLHFNDEDYSPDNYARFCQLARALSVEHAMSLRQIDRALFAFHKLMDAGVFLD
jgi:hypothetical protein